jgi:hypothetical protein
MRFRRAGNVEALLEIGGLRHIEAEGGKPGCSGPSGADF